MEHTRWCGKDANCEYAKRIERETPANARLIAAAPDLLVACEALLASHTNIDAYETACEQARAAIQKARK